jgi:hypothetical protein
MKRSLEEVPKTARLEEAGWLQNRPGASLSENVRGDAFECLISYFPIKL